MHLQLEDVRAFYSHQDGQRAARVIARTIAPLIRRTANHRLLGLGPVAPILQGFDHSQIAHLAIADPFGLGPFPSRDHNLVSQVDARHLPFAEALFDQALVLHLLELDARPERLLREIWRVLAPGGDMVLIVANRAGLWTHFEATPFGHGSPFGRNQLGRLLHNAMFEVLDWQQILVAPPMRGLRWLDTPLTRLLPRLGGVHVVRARKSDGYSPNLVGRVAVATQTSPASG